MLRPRRNAYWQSDGALPIWSWVIHLRDDAVEGLMQSTDPTELTGVEFLRPAGPDR